ncbi:MAG: hypothetical protein AAGJ18_04165 [Bacteroidota bacterium]
MSYRIYFLCLIILITTISCKKAALKKEQSGTYLGSVHYQAHYWTWEYGYDSLTMQVNRSEQIYTNHQIDTVMVDTARVAFSKDSILIYHRGGIYGFPFNENSTYRLSYPGYTFFDYALSEDTLFAAHNWVINRGADRPGTASINSVLIKEN